MRINTLLATLLLAIFFISGCSKNKLLQDKQLFYDAADKATAFIQEQKKDSAYLYLNKALQASFSDDSKVYALIELALLEIQVGSYNSSEEMATQALQITGSTAYLPHTYTILGMIYVEQQNYDEAIHYNNKALEVAELEIQKCIIRNNMSYVYMEKKDFKKAIEIQESIVAIDTLIKDKRNWAKVLDNLGFSYFKTNDEKAYKYLKQAEHLRDSLNDDFEKIASYIHLAEYHQATNQPLALEYSKKTYNAATLAKSPDDQIEALQFAIRNAPMEETKALALEQIKISDSIYRARQNHKNQFARIKYDSTKALYDKEKSHQQSIIILWILAAVALFSVIIILFIRYRSRIKLTQSVYTTETRISKKIHDELANDVFQALAFVETQDLSNPEVKEKFLDDLDHIYTRTRNISNDNSTIDTGENYPDHFFNMMGNFNSDETNVIINAAENLSFVKIKKETKIVLYRVMQELLVNMKKHSKSSVVVISIAMDSKKLEVKYSDNGQGFNTTTFHKNGLQNVENRILAVKGLVTFDSQSSFGLKINIILPL